MATSVLGVILMVALTVGLGAAVAVWVFDLAADSETNLHAPYKCSGNYTFGNNTTVHLVGNQSC